MKPAATHVVETRGLGKRFGRHWALAHIDLSVDPGEVVLLAGANGSGKTTLLRLLAGLYRPTRGAARVLGHSLPEERLAARRGVSLLSHDSYLYGRLTARETLRFWSGLRGERPAPGDLDRLLAEVALEAFADNEVGSFSAGMKKRLSLLRTRLEAPRLVLFDEPFAALDAAGKKLAARWIREFRAAGAAVLVASHAIERSVPLADRALLLDGGQMIWAGAPGELSARMSLS